MCPVRGYLPHPVPLRPYQWLYVDSKARDKDTRLYITQVLKYRGDTHLGKRQLNGFCKYVFYESPSVAMPRIGLFGYAVYTYIHTQ
jgi:hypothetical protein